jgi:hypothetical protein
VTLLTAACMGDGGDAAEPAARPAATGTEETTTTTARPLPPSDFAAEAGSFRVVLSWVQAPGDAEAERYAVYRDGSMLISMSGSETTFTDDTVLPGREYFYEIESRSGDAVSDRIPTSTETLVPPLRAARVAGAFNVRTRTPQQERIQLVPGPGLRLALQAALPRRGVRRPLERPSPEAGPDDARPAWRPVSRVVHGPVYDPVRGHPGDLVGRDRARGGGRPRDRTGVAGDTDRRKARSERGRAARMRILQGEPLAQRPPGPVRSGTAPHRR